MTIQRFYRLSIWLPVLIPLVVGLISRLLTSVADLGNGVVSLGVASIAGLVLFGGPYIPFALFATWWIRKQDEDDIRRLMFFTPILMTIVAFVLCVVGMLIGGGVANGLEIAGLAMTVYLLVGYGWVLLTCLLRLLIQPTDTAQATNS